MNVPAPPRRRLTLPLFRTWFENASGAILTERFEVAPHVWLAPLDDTERERIARSLLLDPLDSAWFRLEIHGMEDPAGAHPSRQAARVLGLLTCVVRLSPTWLTSVLDEFDEQRDEWIRVDRGYGRGGFDHRYSPPASIPFSRLESWSDLVRNWPTSGMDRVELALAFYERSVVDRPIEPYLALASASFAFETLLGGQLHQELSHRMATRAALLVERDDPRAVYTLVKSWYDLRSKLTHAGQRPEAEEVVRFQQFLMRAIPSLARLIEVSGSYVNAIAALDEAPFGRPPLLDGLFDDTPAWWRKVDVLAAQAQPAL